MALSTHTKRAINYGVKSVGIGTEISAVIDAGSGTLSDNAARSLEFLVVDKGMGEGITAKINAGSALTEAERNALAISLADRSAADEIATELSS